MRLFPCSSPIKHEQRGEPLGIEHIHTHKATHSAGEVTCDQNIESSLFISTDQLTVMRIGMC